MQQLIGLIFCHNVLFAVQISEEWSKGVFVIQAGDEDIHTANERRLKVK